MQPGFSISFVRRGLPALLLIAAGIALSIVFKKSSAWPAETKLLMYALALVLGVGGTTLFGSYVRQRPLSSMKTQLISSALMVAILLVAKR
ncbi:hypothetical protein A0257_14255 [Hymenobacter psoromatis]|nr:hypothetical protein A0257_14255 [Hymenobacter psoromatis]